MEMTSFICRRLVAEDLIFQKSISSVLKITLMVNTIIADLHNKSHADDFMTVLSSYAEDPMGGDEPLSAYTVEHLVPQLKILSNHILILCYVDQNIAGLCNCFIGFSSFKAMPLLNIHDFAILPSFRNKGLSKYMLEKAEAVAVSKGCCKMTLEVLENNSRAQKVYKIFGFKGYELNPEMGRAVFWEKSL